MSGSDARRKPPAVVPTRGPSRLQPIAILAGLLLVAAISAARAAGTFGGRTADLALVCQVLPLGLIAAVSCLRAGPRGTIARRGWGLLSAALLLLTADRLIVGLGIGPTRLTAGSSLADTALTAALRLAPVGTLLAGVLALLARAPVRRRLAAGLDALAVAGAGLTAAWPLLIAPALRAGATAGGRPQQLAAILWPVGDVLLLAALAAILVRGAMVAGPAALRMLLAGAAGYSLVDLVTCYRSVHGSTLSAAGWNDLLWLLPPALLGLAARWHRSVAAIAATGETPAPLAVVGPLGGRFLRPDRVRYLALACGFAVFTGAAWRAGGLAGAGLAAGAVLMTAGLTVRGSIIAQENRELAITDSLTGLANRLPLRVAIERAAARSRRSGLPMAVLVLDLDGFRTVNDSLGQRAGDAMLIRFAEVLTGGIRSTDLAARLGADEFAVVLEEVSAAQAVTVAQRIQQEAAQLVHIEGQYLPVPCSVGIALADPADPAAEPSPELLLYRAEQAMRTAKQAGSLGWRVYREDEPAAAADSALPVRQRPAASSSAP